MFKHRLPVVLGAAILGITASIAVAQNNSPSDPQVNEQQAPPAQANGGWQHHGPPDPARRTQELTRRLKLTPDQQTKVQDILQSEKSQMESLHQDAGTPQPDRRAKMMDIHKGGDAQIREVLDPAQQKKWDEMKARHEEMREHHHEGPPNGGEQPAPPPQ